MKIKRKKSLAALATIGAAALHAIYNEYASIPEATSLSHENAYSSGPTLKLDQAKNLTAEIDRKKFWRIEIEPAKQFSLMMENHADSMHNNQKRQVIEAYFSKFDHLKSLTLEEQAHEVDQSIDTDIGYIKDTKLYNEENYYACPYETIKNGAGDCEDHAIIKYFILLHLGNNPENLKILFHLIEDQKKVLAHTVLAINTARADEEPYILISDYADNPREPTTNYPADRIPNTTFSYAAISGDTITYAPNTHFQKGFGRPFFTIPTPE